MTPVGKAFWLALANVVLIAFALTYELRPHHSGVPALIMAYAFWPAVPLAYVLGKIAESTATHHPVRRFAVLAIPACALVCMLAGLFDMLHFVPHACIPTLVAASILERSTRAPLLLPLAEVGR